MSSKKPDELERDTKLQFICNVEGNHIPCSCLFEAVNYRCPLFEFDIYNGYVHCKRCGKYHVGVGTSLERWEYQ